MEKRFSVQGKVQGVFFRKSFVHWLEKLGLKGGATNDPHDGNKVHCTILDIDDDRLSQLFQTLSSGKFNNMGAQVESAALHDHGIPWQDHHAVTSEEPSKLPLGIKLKI